MANYNTFVVFDNVKRKNILVTSSAKKAKCKLNKGIKIEVWNENTCIETIYTREINEFEKYVNLEKQYIARRQEKAELRNKKRERKRQEKAQRAEEFNLFDEICNVEEEYDV